MEPSTTLATGLTTSVQLADDRAGLAVARSCVLVVLDRHVLIVVIGPVPFIAEVAEHGPRNRDVRVARVVEQVRDVAVQVSFFDGSREEDAGLVKEAEGGEECGVVRTADRAAVSR